MQLPNFLASILPNRSMNTLTEILKILDKQPYIKFSVENNSAVWGQQWVVSLNMMNGRGAEFFHNATLDGALREALKFLKNYSSK